MAAMVAMGVRHLFQLLLAIALLSACQGLQCLSTRRKLDDVSAFESAMVLSATCTTKCETVYTKNGKVSLVLKCHAASSNCLNTNECKQCNKDDCNTIAGAEKNFAKCPEFDAAKSTFSSTLKQIYCAGANKDKCQRFSYGSGGANLWMGCAADCETKRNGKTGAKTACEDIIKCRKETTPTELIDSDNFANCATKSVTTNCHGKLAGTQTNGKLVKWILDCGPCPAGTTKDTDCFECSGTGCSIANSIKNAKSLTKCEFYDGEADKVTADSVKTIYCKNAATCQKFTWTDNSDKNKIYMGCSGDCAEKKPAAESVKKVGTIIPSCSDFTPLLRCKKLDETELTASTTATNVRCAAGKCKTIYTEKGKVSLELKCGAASCSVGSGKKCVQCNTDNCNTVENAVKNFAKCPGFDNSDTSFPGSGTPVPEIYCAGDATQKRCQRLSYKDSNTKAAKIWMGCAADCDKSGKTEATDCKKIINCPIGTDVASVVVKKFANCVTKAETTDCYYKFTSTGAGKKVKWNLGCGKCDGVGGKKGVDCFECGRSTKCIYPKNISKCASYNDKKADFALEKKPIYCSGSDAKCNGFEYRKGSNVYLWMGCPGDCEAARTHEEKNSATKIGECEETIKCRTASAEKAFSSARFGVCSTKYTTCYGKFAITDIDGKEMAWELGCGKCDDVLVDGKKGTDCFECSGTGCSIANSIKEKKSLTKCEFYDGEKKDLKATRPTVYCSGNVKCNKLKWTDSSTKNEHIFMGCPWNCEVKRIGSFIFESCIEIAPPTEPPTGKTDDAGKASDGAADAKKKRSSQLLPGSATLLALSLLAALL